MRQLASIQKIIKVEPIQGADAIEVASILGWKVVVKKDEFKVNDLVVYFEIDSIVKPLPQLDFLASSSYRIKTRKMRGQISQGLIMPLSILPDTFSLEEGTDLTDLLEVRKYEPEVPAQLSGLVKGNFPSVVPKTDETRIQSVQEVLEELKGKPYFITVKLDGSSATFANIDGEHHVCSRNLSLTEDANNSFWKIYHKYNMRPLLDDYPNFAIQGELVGPGIQKNPLCISNLDFYVFQVYKIREGKYLDFKELSEFCTKNELKMVPIEEEGESFDFTMDQLLQKAEGRYPQGKTREGIVIRPQTEMFSPVLKGRLSFKAINNTFLLKEE